MNSDDARANLAIVAALMNPGQMESEASKSTSTGIPVADYLAGKSQALSATGGLSTRTKEKADQALRCKREPKKPSSAFCGEEDGQEVSSRMRSEAPAANQGPASEPAPRSTPLEEALQAAAQSPSQPPTSAFLSSPASQQPTNRRSTPPVSGPRVVVSSALTALTMGSIPASSKRTGTTSVPPAPSTPPPTKASEGGDANLEAQAKTWQNTYCPPEAADIRDKEASLVKLWMLLQMLRKNRRGQQAMTQAEYQSYALSAQKESTPFTGIESLAGGALELYAKGERVRVSMRKSSATTEGASAPTLDPSAPQLPDCQGLRLTLHPDSDNFVRALAEIRAIRQSSRPCR